jgi:hypothetical protein
MHSKRVGEVMKTTSVFFFMGLLLTGCAKERDYKQIFKENTFDTAQFKELCSVEDPCIYIPSVGNTPMNVTASIPFFQGDQKLVTFKFNERSLEVLELPTDERFMRNENNFSPVFKLDVTHKDFKCAEDAFGKCANKEEEDKDKPWHQKRMFQADFSKLAVLETNTLPEQLNNLFTNCFNEAGASVTRLEQDGDALNITVQRTLVAKFHCADIESWDDLRNMTFKIDNNYSFVKLSKIASPDYKPVIYPFKDQNTFGFFTTTRKRLSADHRTTIDSDVTYMNRWNPNRKEIVYYLSDAFYDKDLASVKLSTEKAVETVNRSFEAANVDMRIRLADGRGMNVGDIRKSFLILVKDPLASGPIGYGPSVVNPLTGEILKAQSVMYYGSIRRSVQDTYEELVAEHLERAAKAESAAAELERQSVSNGKLSAGVSSEVKENRESRRQMHQRLLKDMRISARNRQAPHQHGHAHGNFSNRSVNNSQLAQRLQKEIFSASRVYRHNSLEEEIEEYSRKNIYHREMINWHDAVSSAFVEGKISLQNAKPWNQLSDKEKESYIDVLVPYVWEPTLVHEIGHNLGLRHNFNGSEDKENYFSPEERAKLGIQREIPYSSVMDYSYSNLNQLPVMGKYDIAALRFGYNREVELKDGTIHKISAASLDSLQKAANLEFKDYQYCTDEHVMVNPGCNRFDEGSGLEEIAKHYVRAYHKYYEKVNKRNNRLSFSGFGDANYYMFLNRTFYGMRLFFEVFDRINGLYPNLSEEQWESIDFLKDLRKAVNVVADFYISVLKTPSVHCAVIDLKSGQLAGVVPLENITMDAISCFDDENIMLDKSRFGVIGQTGKHFNHARGPYMRGDLKADPTQIDIRGIWVDKLLAFDFLTKRELGITTFDNYRTTFLDYPEYKDRVLEAITGFMNDTIDINKAEFELASGKIIPMDHTFTVGETHNIVKSFHPMLNRHLGISRMSTDFRELALPMLKKNFTTADDPTQTIGLLRSFSVTELDPTRFVNQSELASVVELKGGSRFGATNANVLARGLIEKRAQREKLAGYDRNLLIQTFNRRAQELENPAAVRRDTKASDVDAFLEALDLDVLLAYLRGEMPNDDWFHRILNIMSK